MDITGPPSLRDIDIETWSSMIGGMGEGRQGWLAMQKKNINAAKSKEVKTGVSK
jgi:hypothetical protein